jgi:hypothetical protein
MISLVAALSARVTWATLLLTESSWFAPSFSSSSSSSTVSCVDIDDVVSFAAVFAEDYLGDQW